MRQRSHVLCIRAPDFIFPAGGAVQTGSRKRFGRRRL